MDIVVRGLCAWSLMAAVSLIGCGGGRSSHTHPLSKSQFMSRADAICATGTRRMDSLQRPSGMPGIATLMAAALPIEQEAQAKLDALVPPASDRARYASLLDMIAQSITKTSELRSAAEADDERRVQNLYNDLAALQQRENGASEELGLKQCVSEGEDEG